MKKQWLPGCSAPVHISSPMMAARASTSWLCSSFITLDDGQTLTHGDETLTHATRRSRTATETERAPDGRLSEWESIPGVHLGIPYAREPIDGALASAATSGQRAFLSLAIFPLSVRWKPSAGILRAGCAPRRA